MLVNLDLQIISAPSILGLRPSGVELLAESLLRNGLAKALNIANEVIYVDTLNDEYSRERDHATNILNPESIRKFSISLGKVLADTFTNNRIPFVLGGDCSILLAPAVALKALGNYGLIFLDAHADFYEPGKSITGEVADMELAIVTGRGPDVLTNINNLRPYFYDGNVIHIGQRDQDETLHYGSQDIRSTGINCFSHSDIRRSGVEQTIHKICDCIKNAEVDGFWLHFDTDVLSDDINPAVDYRLPDGMCFYEVEYIIRNILKCADLIGVDITIFNPQLDSDQVIARQIVQSIGRAFRSVTEAQLRE
jgi:arginase